MEARSLRDFNAEIEQAGAAVVGISKDSLSSHEKFIAKHELPFLLLADEEAEMATAYGAWGEKKLYGRTFMGMNRMTFLVDEKGKIAKVWAKVKPADHGEEVLAAVRGG